MRTATAEVVSRNNEYQEIIFKFEGYEALVKLDSWLVAGIDLIQDAKEGNKFNIEYFMAPDTEPDAGPVIVRIIGSVS